jgi:hypothetical protein
LEILSRRRPATAGSFLDVLRRRGNYQIKTVKDPRSNVLRYAHEEIMNGRDFEKPISYYLLRILPPAGVHTDARRRPVIVVDPRAGQSPASAASRTRAKSARRCTRVTRCIS